MHKLNETRASQIAALLREWSARSELTQKEIEARTGVHQTQISRIMAGKFRRLQGNVAVLCKYAKIDIQIPLKRGSMPPNGSDGLSTARMVAQYVGVPQERAALVRDLLDGIAVLLNGGDSPD